VGLLPRLQAVFFNPSSNYVVSCAKQANIYQDDEYDEYDSAGAGADGFPISYFWDITSLEAPVLTGYFRNEYALGIDHNQYM